MSDQKYTIVDLFAGAGGLSYGFMQTGRFEIKAAFENNKNARTTYERNHKDVEMHYDVITADYAELKERLGDISVVIGGPPCQGFSNANRQKNHAVSQNNSLVKQYIRAVVELNPSAFIMENVSMLKSNTHKFYVDANDYDTIKKYNIPTVEEEILLLDSEFVFDEAQALAGNIADITDYLWDEADYLVLNVIYKNKNIEKLKRALEKHRSKLEKLIVKWTNSTAENEHYVLSQNHRAADALNQYFKSNENLDSIHFEIESAVMIQRMLGKAKELYDNRIVVSEIKSDNGIFAKVTSMAVLDYINSILGSKAHGYVMDKGVLCAADFGAPQKRMRFVIMGIKTDISPTISLPIGTITPEKYRTVKDAIFDLEDVLAGEDAIEQTGVNLPKIPDNISKLGRELRDTNTLYNHVKTKTTKTAQERFDALKQGENFHNLDDSKKSTYSNKERTQNTIYLKLKYDEPSGTVVNVRKSMWIHPTLNRAISIREAARLQTFSDSFIFKGTKDSQYQQVGNAVPPMLANALATQLLKFLQ